MDESGAATASVITYLVPVVALALGISVLGEKLTRGTLAGLPLIAGGARLATRAGRQDPTARTRPTCPTHRGSD